MLTRLLEEVGEIHFISAGVVFAEADCLDKSLVVVDGIKEGKVNAAEIDEIESGAPHYEHGLKLVGVGKVGEIHDPATVLIHGKLANALQLTVHQCLVGQQLGVKGNAATCA